MPSSDPPILDLPALCLVVLVGVSDTERAAFAQRHFALEEVCRRLEAARDRLAAAQLAVLDAAHLSPPDRRPALALAREQDVDAAAVVLDPQGAALEAEQHRQRTVLRTGLGGPDSPELRVAGFRPVYRLRSEEALHTAQVRRVPLPVDRRDVPGPFDVIGDVHGCLHELRALLSRLGYTVDDTLHVTPPPGRKAVFLGDLVDRGPDTPGVLRLVMNMVAAGTALCVLGNHDDKLLRALEGHPVGVTHGLALSLSQLARTPAPFQQQVRDFLRTLPPHLLLDGGRLVAAHAGLPGRYQGRTSERARHMALYGTAERGGPGPGGRPLRTDWAAGYHGRALVAYGHTPVPVPRWTQNTVNLDTGCIFGGTLSALRYPELETRSVPAGV